MFTKQQYESIAKVIAKHPRSDPYISKRILVLKLQQMFEEDNPRFKGYLWRKACGMRE